MITQVGSPFLTRQSRHCLNLQVVAPETQRQASAIVMAIDSIKEEVIIDLTCTYSLVWE